MVDKNLMIAVAISVVVFMGFVLLTNMTGNVITGNTVSGEPVIEEELFKINNLGEREYLNETNESEVYDDKS